ncbi:MAG TPA: PIG-L family deacetylase [Trebonia sp.]|nr:PIG-L family deacetylase [Trebonia sp.]
MSRPGAVPHPIDAPGTDEDTWAAWPRLDMLPNARTTALFGATSAVVVAAHPDDEVLGAGGLISVLAAAGARLRLVAVTDGESSHRGLADPAILAKRRTAETVDALHALGAETTEVVRLGLPDAGLAGREDQLAAALAPLTAGFDVCLAPWDGDLHPDHAVAGRAARRTARLVLCYPIWMWHWASPADPRVPWDRALRVPLPPRAAAMKRAAIGCFASQTQDRGDGLGPVLAPAMIAHFTRPMEVLLP